MDEKLILQGVVDPAVPLTLDKYDAAKWEFQREVKGSPLIQDAVRGRPVVTYIARNRDKGRDDVNANTTLGAGEWRTINTAIARQAGQSVD